MFFFYLDGITPNSSLTGPSNTKYIYIYIYTHVNTYVFANGLVDRGSIPGRVIPKTQKNGTGCHLA